MSELSEIGKRIAIIRKDKGLTQKQLIQQIGNTQAYLSAIELGKLKPSLRYLMVFLEKIDVSPTWLFLNRGPRYLKKKGAK